MVPWALGIAFVAGLMSPAVAVLCTALATFVQAFASPRAPWRAALLSLTAWGAGIAVSALLNLLNNHDFVFPSELVGGITVLTAYTSACAGAWVNWVAARLGKDRSLG